MHISDSPPEENKILATSVGVPYVKSVDSSQATLVTPLVLNIWVETEKC